MGDFTLCSDGKADRVKVFKLNFENSIDVVTFLDWRYLNCHFDQSPFFFSNFESNLFEVFKSFVASHAKNVFIKSIKLSVTALSDNPQHEGIRTRIFINDLFLQVDGYIDFFDGSREEGRLPKANVAFAYIDEVFGFMKLFVLVLSRFAIFFSAARIWIFLFGLGTVLLSYFDVLHESLNLVDLFGEVIYKYIGWHTF